MWKRMDSRAAAELRRRRHCRGERGRLSRSFWAELKIAAGGLGEEHGELVGVGIIDGEVVFLVDEGEEELGGAGLRGWGLVGGEGGMAVCSWGRRRRLAGPLHAGFEDLLATGAGEAEDGGRWSE